jgi:hypothetical protein
MDDRLKDKDATGLETWKKTVFETPPPEAGLETVIEAVPAAVMSAVCTAACNCV